MSWTQWLAENWFDALQSLGIIGGLVVTCISLRRDDQSRRVGNLFKLTASHRDLWSHLFVRPQLRRIFESAPDLSANPITEDELLFVGLLIQHLSSAHHAIKAGLMNEPEGITTDIRSFFSCPIPRAVWTSVRYLHDSSFVAFVERIIGEPTVS